MGVIFKYFSAASDELAASVVDDGPGGSPPFPENMKAPEIIRLYGIERLRELTKPTLWQAETGLYVVATKGFDPVADLGEIETLLTGAEFEALLQRP